MYDMSYVTHVIYDNMKDTKHGLYCLWPKVFLCDSIYHILLIVLILMNIVH